MRLRTSIMMPVILLLVGVHLAGAVEQGWNVIDLSTHLPSNHSFWTAGEMNSQYVVIKSKDSQGRKHEWAYDYIHDVLIPIPWPDGIFDSKRIVNGINANNEVFITTKNNGLNHIYNLDTQTMSGPYFSDYAWYDGTVDGLVVGHDLYGGVNGAVGTRQDETVEILNDYDGSKLFSISEDGKIACGQKEPGLKGFIYDIETGEGKIIPHPDGFRMWFSGCNSHGDAVGSFKCQGNCPVLYKDGVVTYPQAPGSSGKSFTLRGITDDGSMSGDYLGLSLVLYISSAQLPEDTVIDNPTVDYFSFLGWRKPEQISVRLEHEDFVLEVERDEIVPIEVVIRLKNKGENGTDIVVKKEFDAVGFGSSNWLKLP